MKLTSAESFVEDSVASWTTLVAHAATCDSIVSPIPLNDSIMSIPMSKLQNLATYIPDPEARLQLLLQCNVSPIPEEQGPSSLADKMVSFVKKHYVHIICDLAVHIFVHFLADWIGMHHGGSDQPHVTPPPAAPQKRRRKKTAAVRATDESDSESEGSEPGHHTGFEGSDNKL